MIMKKIYSIIASAIIAVGFTACTQSDFVETSAPDVSATSIDNAIQFGTYMGKVGTTRAVTPQASPLTGPIANNADATNKVLSLAQARFGVFSYLTVADYNRNSVGTSPSNIAPNFMYDQEIQWDDAKSWIYDPVKYWPNGIDSQNSANSPSNSAEQDNTYAKKLSFFAYAPFMAMSNFNTAGTGTAGTDYPTAIGANTNFKTVTSPSNGIVAMTTNAFTGNVWLKYMMPNANETDAIDMLWGTRGTTNYDKAGSSSTDGATIGVDYNTNLTKQTVDERVKFLFKHALAKIGGSTTETKNLDEPSTKCGIKVQLDIDGNTGDNQSSYFSSGFNKEKTLVTIKDVKIMDGGTANTYTSETTTSDIFNTGWFNIETGLWDMTGATKTGVINITAQNNKSNDNAATHTYTINPKIRENSSSSAVKNATGVNWNPSANSSTDGYTGGAEGVEATPKPLFANEYVPGLLFIPGNVDQTLYVRVDYIVRTADANLSTGYTEVEQVILNKVTLSNTVLQSNKIYDIIMHLGLTSVKFEAKVSDWQRYSDSSLDTDGNETGGTSENQRSVWLPSNVVKKTVAANATAAAGNTAVALSDLEGTTLTVVDQDGTVVTGATDLTVTAGAATVQVACTVNNGTTKREGWVKLSDGYKTITINITQAAGALTVSGTGSNLGVASFAVVDAVSTGLTITKAMISIKDETDADVSFTVNNDANVSQITFGTALTTGKTYTITVTYNDATGTKSVSYSI